MLSISPANIQDLDDEQLGVLFAEGFSLPASQSSFISGRCRAHLREVRGDRSGHSFINGRSSVPRIWCTGCLLG